MTSTAMWTDVQRLQLEMEEELAAQGLLDPVRADVVLLEWRCQRRHAELMASIAALTEVVKRPLAFR